tara:strand:+ start:10111 stop:10932 length:822 start_codon:yes stop_codon:yes gene_type:complete
MTQSKKKRSKRKLAKKKSSAKSKSPTRRAAAPKKSLDLKVSTESLEKVSAEERIAWALKHFPTQTVVSSSFGAQSAVSLHMATQLKPDVPVVLIDTGYLFPETYDFIDQLKERLDLNLRVFSPAMSPAWQERRYGKLWEQGTEGIERYNQMNKVEPMNRAIEELKAKVWISGVRRDQSDTRGQMDVLGVKNGTLRVHPIIDWNDKDIYDYLTKHDLPYHPLWEQGYISIGDWHTSHKLTDLQNPNDARFFGLKRECGLHEDTETAAQAGDYMI